MFAAGVVVSFALMFAPVSADFARPCTTHIPEAWTGAVRSAALADCAFSTESQTTGAVAWARYAAEDAAMGPHRGPAEIRATQETAYARPGVQTSLVSH